MADDAEQAEGESITGNLAVCAFVERSHLFKGLAREDLGHLFQTGRLVRCRAGEVFMREGEPGGEMYLLMEGSVRVSTGGKQGEIELAQLKRGAVIGEVGVLTGRPRTATVTALESIALVGWSKADMDVILRKYPKVRKLLQAMVEGRVRTTIEKAQS